MYSRKCVRRKGSDVSFCRLFYVPDRLKNVFLAEVLARHGFGRKQMTAEIWSCNSCHLDDMQVAGSPGHAGAHIPELQTQKQHTLAELGERGTGADWCKMHEDDGGGPKCAGGTTSRPGVPDRWAARRLG